MNIENHDQLPIKSSDKVVCIDATPLPNVAPRDAVLDDFFLPDGFVEEGVVYCVEHAFEHSPGVFALSLIGKKVFYLEKETGWYWERFRIVGQLRETREMNEVLEVGK